MPLFKRFRAKKTLSKEASDPKQKTALTELPPAYPPDWSPEQTEQIIASSTNPAFLEAWKLHWMDLSESEKLAWSFRDPLKVSKTIEDMDKLHRENSISRRIAARTLRFLQAIETLMAGVSIGIQAYPDVSAIVVGVIRVIINIAVKYFEYYEKLSQMLERLSEHIAIFDLFTQNNSNEQLLNRTLVALYRHVLAFCRHARRAFVDQKGVEGSNGFAVFAKVQWAPFEQQFGQIQSNLEHYMKSLDMVSTAITMNSALEIREDLKKKLSAETENERRKFLDWVCQENIEEIHESIRGKRLVDTGSWLLENSTYKTWKSEVSAGPLWLCGPAGTGKSVLASMVIDHLNDHAEYPDHTVAYIYYKGEDINIRNLPIQVMSMLVKQLCWDLKTLPDTVLKPYRECEKNARQPTFEILKSLFMDCVGYLGKVFVVFDGYDECEEKHRKLLSKFACEVGTKCASVKVFVTSRWERDIENMFKRYNFLQINSTPIEKDVAKVARYRVINELEHISSKLQEDIIKLLIEKSGGIFLWLNFQLDDLAQVSEQDMKTQLQCLPSGLQETYLEMLQKIDAQPQTSRVLAQNCFLWALHTHKLLDSVQLVDAVSLGQKLSGNATYTINSVEQVTRRLLRFSAFGRVRPVHFSFQEYITGSASLIPPNLKAYVHDSDSANSRLAVLCLENLMADVPPAGLLDTVLVYCAQFFDSHIRRLTKVSDEVLNLLDRLLNREPHKLLKILTWRWPIDHDKYPNMSCVGSPSSMDPLFFLQCTKLDAIPAIQSRFSNFETLKPHPEGYLHIAALTGLADAVRDMISQGADVNRVDVDGLSALYYACVETDEVEIVKRLVEGGADINQQSPEGRSLLRTARYYDRVNISAYMEEIGATE